MTKKDVMDYWWRSTAPRSIVLVTSRSKDGKLNVMPMAWSMPVSQGPPLLTIAMSKRNYSHELINETGEFVLNIPTKQIIDEVNTCGSTSGRSVDKIKNTGLSISSAKTVKPPIINECIAHIECKVVDKFDAGDHTLFVGRVLAAYAEDELFTEFGWDLTKAKPLLHVGGRLYAEPSTAIKPKNSQ